MLVWSLFIIASSMADASRTAPILPRLLVPEHVPVYSGELSILSFPYDFRAGCPHIRVALRQKMQ